MSVTNIFVKPDEQPPMRISSQRGFTLNYRKKFQRPPTKHEHSTEVLDSEPQADTHSSKQTGPPKGTTTKHQHQTFRGDK